MGKDHVPGTDPQTDHGNDEEAHRKIADAILADPVHDHPAHPGKPIAEDEFVVAETPPWHEDKTHPGPHGWHRALDPSDPEGFVWVRD